MVDIEHFKRKQQLIELRYNPYHDPSNGRFTSGGGGGGGGLLVVPKGQKGKGFYTSAAKQYYTDEKGQTRFIWDNKGKQDLEADRETALADMYNAMMTERDLLVNKEKYIAEIENAPAGKLHGIAEGYSKYAKTGDGTGVFDHDEFIGKITPNNGFGYTTERVTAESLWDRARRDAGRRYDDAYLEFTVATNALNGAYGAGYKSEKNIDPNRKYRNGQKRY